LIDVDRLPDQLIFKKWLIFYSPSGVIQLQQLLEINGSITLSNVMTCLNPDSPDAITTSVLSVKEWFDRVQLTIMQHGIALEDIYNFDEVGYAMGLTATAKVVSRAEMTGRPFLVQPGNREWVTSIKCIQLYWMGSPAMYL